jgi:predicted nuclease of predicted toxin-antitoxin system
MKFKVDENLPVEVAELLRQQGDDAVTVMEQALGGAVDSMIAEVCAREQRVLITIDTDFADIRTYPPEDFHGLIVLRLKQQDKPFVLRVLANLLPVLASESPDKQLWIVEKQRIRIRS